jgi:hypothetical protein
MIVLVWFVSCKNSCVGAGKEMDWMDGVIRKGERGVWKHRTGGQYSWFSFSVPVISRCNLSLFLGLSGTCIGC